MAPLTRSSLFGVLVGGAYASDTCAASGTCTEDTALLQMHGLKNAIRRHGVKAKTSNWPQHEVDASKCNLNVDMVYVADQDACEALAVDNGHPYYSFRHNAESDGHKCMSSETCGDDLIGDRTNEWKIYYQNFWPQHEVDNSKCNNNVEMVYVANQQACQDLAVANGHQFYSFRHNGQDAGHKCMSSAECGDDALIGDRTNDWNIYSAPKRFIRQAEGTGIYWEELGHQYWVPSCSLCVASSTGPTPCGGEVEDSSSSGWNSVAQSYIDSLVVGDTWQCTQHADYAPHRFIRETGGTAIYWQEAGMKYWVNSCSVCDASPTGPTPCGGEQEDSTSSGWNNEPASYIDSLESGPTFQCSQHPDYDPIENQCLGIYEAESATLEGAVVATNHDGFTGDAFVDYKNANGDYIEWSVSSCGGGSATASFRYALSSGDRPLQVLVNGVEVAAALSFPATGSWSSWGEASVAVELNAGSNVVKLVVTGTSGANTDSLTIS